jgi:hypothetical protein
MMAAPGRQSHAWTGADCMRAGCESHPGVVLQALAPSGRAGQDYAA